MKLRKKVLSKEGSSMVAVLMFLSIFITLSSALLMLSVKNVNMEEKISSVNSGYYDLDRAMEKTLVKLEQNFESAEVKSVSYIKERNYESESNEWKKTVKKVESNELKFNIGSVKPSFFYNRWQINVNKESNYKIDMEIYNKNLNIFCEQAFGKLYYAYLDEILDDYKDSKTYPIEIDKDNKVDINITVKKNRNYESLNVSKWDEFKPKEEDFEINVEAKNKNGRTLNMVVRPIVPVYNIIKREEKLEEKKDVIEDNPIYTNAITAGGGIKFKKNCNISGDIYSSNKEGISIKSSVVTVSGNVYSKGDIITTGGEDKLGSILMVMEGSTKNNVKKSIYKNNIFFDKTILKNKDIDKYTEGESSTNKGTSTFFIFNDSKGGNVYCDNIKMDKSVKSGSKIIVKNGTTKGSVINDSLYGGADIIIENNYIGISPYRAGVNFGSYIENNIYELAHPNNITVNGIFIVPGVKPVQTMDGDKSSYESVSCNFWDNANFDYIRDAYLTKSLGKYKTEYKHKKIMADSGKIEVIESGIGPVASVDFNDPKAIKDAFINYMNSAPWKVRGDETSKINIENINSRIALTSQEGYCNTSAIVSTGTAGHYIGKLYMGEKIPKGSLIKNNDVNKNDYENLKDVLQDIFEAKTTHFGTKDKEFSNSVDISTVSGKAKEKTGVIYLDGTDNTLDISTDKSGIVYSKGNLIIKGSGTFKGTIICEGNIIVEDKVNIKYDEAVIKEKLKNISASNFFNPKELIDKIVLPKESKIVENSADKKSTKRYKIISWKQRR